MVCAWCYWCHMLHSTPSFRQVAMDRCLNPRMCLEGLEPKVPPLLILEHVCLLTVSSVPCSVCTRVLVRVGLSIAISHPMHSIRSSAHDRSPNVGSLCPLSDHSQGGLVGVVQVAHVASTFCDESVGLLWATSARLVLDWLDIVILDLVQDRREDFPGPAQFVIANECTLLTLQHVQDETGVGIGVRGRLVLAVLEKAGVVVDLELALDRRGVEPRLLDIGLQVHGLVRLHSHHQLVAWA
mmetsp:Transcript_21098/g.58687  ORF Transcript_21098/g.58687 Transcript_21098/m.58687 type:complete len:240 (-) Transcript_21098:843-1562(-)